LFVCWSGKAYQRAVVAVTQRCGCDAAAEVLLAVAVELRLGRYWHANGTLATKAGRNAIVNGGMDSLMPFELFAVIIIGGTIDR
jgi:hypothetical protein